MKKVLALVLAVMMLTTVAMAANASIVGGTRTPGDRILIYPKDLESNGIYLDSALEKRSDFTSKNFSVSMKRFAKGADLVSSVGFDNDAKAVSIWLKNNYTLELNDTIDLIIDELRVTAKKSLNNGAVAKGSKWTYRGATDYHIGHKVVEINISEDFDVYVRSGKGVTSVDGISSRATTRGYLTRFVKDTAPYGNVTINFGDIATAAGRVYDQDLIYLNYNTNDNLNVIKKYPEANLTFVNFKGNPTFNTIFNLEIYAGKDQYVYRVKNNQAAASDLSWDDDAYAYTGKVQTLRNYVISDIELPVAAAANANANTNTNAKNPSTGADDVAGIATVLAVVALVSAAAVSLKEEV